MHCILVTLIQHAYKAIWKVAIISLTLDLSVGAYTPNDNFIRDEVKSALELSLSHLQRNITLVLIIKHILIYFCLYIKD